MTDLLTAFNLKAPFPNASTGQKDWISKGETVTITSPVDGKAIGTIQLATPNAYTKVIKTAQKEKDMGRYRR